MLNDPFSLFPLAGATEASLRAACEALAVRLRNAERERDEAEMVLRRIVYRRRKGLELVGDAEFDSISAIAVRNASPLRSANSGDF
jgi:hypothetical protein